MPQTYRSPCHFHLGHRLLSPNWVAVCQSLNLNLGMSFGKHNLFPEEPAVAVFDVE
jgi:hypothetical protein